jgi:hypothetical protein
MVQALILLCMFFVSTKNLALSVILTIMFHLIIYVLLNETHKYHLLPKSWIVEKPE